MQRVLMILVLPALLMAGSAGFAVPPSPVPGPKASQRRELILARLHQIRVERLQQALGISPEKAGEIADRWGRLDVENSDRHQRMRQLHQQINGILLSSANEEEKNAKIRPLVDQVTTLRQEQNDTKRKFEDEIRASLTPAQQGRFLIAVEEIQRALMEAIKERKAAASSQ